MSTIVPLGIDLVKNLFALRGADSMMARAKSTANPKSRMQPPRLGLTLKQTHQQENPESNAVKQKSHLLRVANVDGKVHT